MLKLIANVKLADFFCTVILALGLVGCTFNPYNIERIQYEIDESRKTPNSTSDLEYYDGAYPYTVYEKGKDSNTDNFDVIRSDVPYEGAPETVTYIDGHTAVYKLTVPESVAYTVSEVLYDRCECEDSETVLTVLLNEKDVAGSKDLKYWTIKVPVEYRVDGLSYRMVHDVNLHEQFGYTAEPVQNIDILGKDK